ncbi:MAG: UTP--glucose-1-phosphate uridylyltransferase [Fimbriiglobus sp.]
MSLDEIEHKIRVHGHYQALVALSNSSGIEREHLLAQLQSLDLDSLTKLFATSKMQSAKLTQTFAPIPTESADDVSATTISLGEDALRKGQVAVLVVAGGQGSRLGFEKPKGLFPIGPITGASLFQIHAEKVLMLSRKYRRALPFLVMTSPQTHAETVEFFTANQNFGLKESQVRFFQQATMPTLDAATGQLLLEGPSSLYLSPNGHGGTLTALADSGLLAELAGQGIEHIFYFQVDNPLVDMASPAFLGRHLETGSEASTKVVFKEKPEEKVGVLALVDGRCGIIEYSDLPRDLAEARNPTGELTYRGGNTAIHLFSVPFLKRVTTGEHRLAYHIARKKVPYYDRSTKTTITPTTENALKFELFIFDALPLAERWLIVAVDRAKEFAPLKNATGPDSAEMVKKAISDFAKAKLATLGLKTDDGLVELSPLCDVNGTQATNYL